ncbi:MAG: SPASM domain-containing protein, partial [Magnetococcales bacterium]|nr:SPASM domain-containing protein [Magnetococcales bacterium]
LCNMDWKFEVTGGDVRTQSLAEAFNTPLLRDYRRRLAARDRNMTLCRGCDDGAPKGKQPGFPPADGWTGLRKLWLGWQRSRFMGKVRRILRLE